VFTLHKIFLLLFFYLFSFSIYSKPVITWYKQNIPPFFISEGIFKDKGSGDSLQSFFESKLPEYSHTSIYANTSRSIESAITAKSFATFGLFETPERKKFLLFSEPFATLSPPKLIFKTENRFKFKNFYNNYGYLDLEKLITQSNLKIGILDERFYSSYIYNIIKKHYTNKNIVKTFSINAYTAQIEMLLLDRLDCIIEFPDVVEYTSITKSLNLNYDSIEFYSDSPYYYISVAVNKNKDNYILLQKINKIILENRYRDEYLNILTSWTKDKKSYKSFYINAMKSFENKK
jgi:uncharacterized protein (TIGR02285 family)